MIYILQTEHTERAASCDGRHQHECMHSLIIRISNDKFLYFRTLGIHAAALWALATHVPVSVLSISDTFKAFSYCVFEVPLGLLLGCEWGSFWGAHEGAHWDDARGDDGVKLSCHVMRCCIMIQLAGSDTIQPSPRLPLIQG